MKKVSIYVPFMTGFGGTETVISNLFAEYNRSGIKDKINLIQVGGYIDSDWLKNTTEKKIIWLNKYRPVRTLEYFLLLPWILLFEVNKQNSDIVISTNPIIWTILYMIKFLFRKNYQVISWYHYSLSVKPIRKFLLYKADAYLAISSGIMNQLVDLGIDKNKIKLVYNPVIQRKQTVNRTKNNEEVRFLYVGRLMLNGQKNIKELIDALKFVKGNWHLDIYGTGNKCELSQYINDQALSNKISFCGFIPDVWGTVQNIDATLLTSQYEGFPMVLNESISVGIPVVSSNCETGPKDIVNKKNGLLYDKGNVNALSAILQQFVDRKIIFTNTKEIKKSIKQFYSDSYFDNFLKVLGL